MVKCRDCKWWHRLNDLGIYGECDIAECPVKKAGQMITFWDMSCIHGERADGMKEVCADCKNYRYEQRCTKPPFDDDDADIRFFKCDIGKYDVAVYDWGDGCFDSQEMVCSEWQSREAKG
ncbi:MAG: hypothetical protein BWY02_02571 [bacterium ADurb.Bin157]|nr:MAG: hypothetical protein BWY02_02571 [bacterium ADurb.Bin157]